MVADSVGRNQVSLVRSSWKRLLVPVTFSVERRVCMLEQSSMPLTRQLLHHRHGALRNAL